MYILPKHTKNACLEKTKQKQIKKTNQKTKQNKTKQNETKQSKTKNYRQFYGSRTFLHVTIYFYNSRVKANSEPISYTKHKKPVHF